MAHVLKDVEDGLWTHMMKNMAKGFVKGGVVGVAVGLAAGALIGALMFAVIPASIISGTALAGAVLGAKIGASVVGTAFATSGGVAGIQASRDARRYIGVHEIDRPSRLTAEDDPLEPVKEQIIDSSPVRSGNSQLFAERVRAATAGGPPAL